MSKVKITTWVDERTAGILRATAAQHEISVSRVCAETLQKALRDEVAEGVGTELLLPAVRGAVRREVGRMSDRLSNLMVRSALEGAAQRRAVYQLLVREFGREEAAKINREAWTQGVQSLKRPAEGLREILGERDEEAERPEANGVVVPEGRGNAEGDGPRDSLEGGERL